MVACDRTVGGVRLGRRCDKGGSLVREWGGAWRGGANRRTEARNRQGGRRRRKKRSKFKVLMDSALCVGAGQQRSLKGTGTGSVYYLQKWAEGRGKPSLGESGASIFIEWN